MPTYDSISSLQAELIRKTVGGSVFIAPGTAPLITALTAKTGTAPNEVIDLLALPTGYEDLGYSTDDGFQFSSETAQSDITSFQSIQPTRTDLISETVQMTVTAQETKMLTLGLYLGRDLSTVTPNVDTGEVTVKRAERPAPRDYRVLCLGVDETASGPIYMARYMPKAKLTGKGEQAYSKADAAVQYPLTFTGFKDSAAGTAEQWFFGGTGWQALLDEMGF